MVEEKEKERAAIEAIEAIRKKERKKGCLIGCLVSIAIAILLAVAFFAASFFFYRYKGPTLIFGVIERQILQTMGPDYTQEEKELISKAFNDFIEVKREAGIPLEELMEEAERMNSEVEGYLSDGRLTKEEIDSILEYLMGEVE